MGGVDDSERRSCTLGDARDANVATIRSTREGARGEAFRELLHREARSAAAVGQNEGVRVIRWKGRAGGTETGGTGVETGDTGVETGILGRGRQIYGLERG